MRRRPIDFYFLPTPQTPSPRVAARVLQRRLGFVFSLDVSRRRPERRALVDYFLAEAEADPALRAISPSAAPLDALQTAVSQRDSPARPGPRGTPPPPGADSAG